MKWPAWLVADDNIIEAIPTKKEEPQKGTQFLGVQNPPPHFIQQPSLSTPLGLDQQQHEKWNNFFNELLISKGDSKYCQFMAMVDSMGAAIPDNIKFPSIFNGLKTMGLTKAGLLEAATKTNDMLAADAEAFKSQMDQRHVKEVEDPQKLIEQKEAAILKLQQEVAELRTGIMNAQQKIQLSGLGYSTYFRQAQTKVMNDIASITNFIPD